MTDQTSLQAESEVSSFACNLNALTSEQRLHHSEVVQRMKESRLDRRELSDGVALKYPNEAWMTLAEFIRNEQVCCPFFRFTLELEPNGGAVWLKLTGAAGVKQFIDAELGLAKPAL